MTIRISLLTRDQLHRQEVTDPCIIHDGQDVGAMAMQGDPVRGQMSAGCAMLASMVIREAEAEDWPAIWPILKEAGNAGETLTWDPARTEARARSGWMRELPGRTIVAVDDDGRVIGSANTNPIHPGPGAHVANAGFVVQPARRGEGAGRALCGHVLDQARADGYRAMQFNAVVETNTPAIGLWRSFGFEILATVPEAFQHPAHGYIGLHIMYRRL